MRSANRSLFVAPGVVVLALSLFVLTGCSNTLNPLCGSARPKPAIQSIAPSTVTFAQVQSGVTITVTGTNFVSASQIDVNSTVLAATVVSPTQITVKLSTDLIPAAGSYKIAVNTPGGGSGDLNCTSGGVSTALTLTVD